MIKLDDVIEALEFGSTDIKFFYDKKKQIIVMVTEPDSYLEEDEDSIELEDEMMEDPSNFNALPNSYDINEYEMMEEFIWSLDSDDKRNKLLHAIDGKGAFRRFKDEVYSIGIEKEWFHFREDGYKEIARKWCKENQIRYSD